MYATKIAEPLKVEYEYEYEFPKSDLLFRKSKAQSDTLTNWRR